MLPAGAALAVCATRPAARRVGAHTYTRELLMRTLHLRRPEKARVLLWQAQVTRDDATCVGW